MFLFLVGPGIAVALISGEPLRITAAVVWTLIFGAIGLFGLLVHSGGLEKVRWRKDRINWRTQIENG